MPDPGTVYRSPDGRPMLYVRTEQRPKAPHPEHLFVWALNRTVMQWWDVETPEEFELIIDTEGRKQANEETWKRACSEREVEVLVGLLKQACSWLPRERANELRARYAEGDEND